MLYVRPCGFYRNPHLWMWMVDFLFIDYCFKTCILSRFQIYWIKHNFCSCKPGTRGDGKERCDDVDECKLKKDICDETTSFCKNLSPGYKCECKPGFRLTKDFKCEDIDECEGKFVCRSNQVCQNTPGSYTCKCKKGYRGEHAMLIRYFYDTWHSSY